MRSRSNHLLSERFVRALCCGLFLFAYLANSLHDASVRHAICAEHGELVDVDSGDLASSLDFASSDDGSSAIVRSGPKLANGEHSHCAFDPFARHATTRVVFQEQSIRFLELAAREPDPQSSFERGFPLYLLAPSHSPPISIRAA